MPALNDAENDLRCMGRGNWWLKAAVKESRLRYSKRKWSCRDRHATDGVSQ
jgi:hypothetical protein